MAQIDIGSVLRHFDDTVDVFTNEVKTYHIRFITADGRLRTLLGRKNVKSPQRQLRAPLNPRGGVTWNLKYRGTMLVHDEEIQAPRAVKVANITGFKESKSSTWLNVYH
jgi:hypothetical protein